MHRPPWCVSASSGVYATKPFPQVGMKKGKAQYERDDAQEGVESGNPTAKKASPSEGWSLTECSCIVK